MNLFQLSALSAAILLATAAGAAPAPSSAVASASEGLSQATIVPREREAGDDRGKHGGGHRLSEDMVTSAA